MIMVLHDINSFKVSTLMSKYSKCKASQGSDPSFIPQTPQYPIKHHLKSIINLSLSYYISNVLNPIKKSNAIGNLYEFKDQNLVLQDISFNVANIDEEVQAFKALFVNKCKEIRTLTKDNIRESVLAFGPDSYRQPSTFYPGISSLFEYGGHATITLRMNTKQSSDVIEYFDKGYI